MAPGGEIYPLWADDATVSRAIDFLRRVIRDARQCAADERADVLIFDRHWMTVMVGPIVETIVTTILARSS
ncbi:hypothetical protein A2304_00230 [Candidatus Uhrbacteria bacterium RIFOXYB2_FULL_57_15]|uniref:Uncharacterized protein n=1 Tax=Candidatus Uhrbacteria bacterium RIFOXYB2_FULL_57_15 TaxID=1802422 RepID=A0A1F7W617_9BACT|nr:MAG: hypothetical protein A2304_00230 [Candidatus Uhrbacteria bacterium RIFOXYB2_FULL_57_15]OGL98951.1 MAG: hypothetical protein A2501_02375 [Candidatus Uhrbacteria bacterium RIFOXYC12_FULL_57_11]